MKYFKNRIKAEIKENFHFRSSPYPISDNVKKRYNAIRSFFHEAKDILMHYQSGNSERDSTYAGAKKLIDFYDAGCLYMPVLIQEIFTEPLDKKQELFVVLNKLLKMFFVYDVLRHKHQNIFHDFSNCKHKIKDSKFVDKFTVLSAISMPMGHLFISYFYTENCEIYVPRELCKRNCIYLDVQKMEHLFKIACIVCKYDTFLYARVFTCGLYNRFFHSGYFIPFIDELDDQKQTYYVALADYTKNSRKHTKK